MIYGEREAFWEQVIPMGLLCVMLYLPRMPRMSSNGNVLKIGPMTGLKKLSVHSSLVRSAIESMT